MSLTTGTQLPTQQNGMDYWLLGATLVLAGLGLIMVLSASGVMAERAMESKYFYFRKQAIFALVGLVIMAWTMDRPEDIRRMIDLQVDALVSNYPERVLELLEG